MRKIIRSNPRLHSSTPTWAIAALSNQDVVEYQPLDPINLTIEGAQELALNYRLSNPPVRGLHFNPETAQLHGTPEITDWAEAETSRELISTFHAEHAGSGQTNQQEVRIKVLRDLDKDGIPDILDEDIDGDGYTNAEEERAGSNPRLHSSAPTWTITATPAHQEIIEGQAINPITLSNSAELNLSYHAELPTGFSLDGNQLQGTPDFGWLDGVETTEITIPITATHSSKDTAETQTTLRILRDTDSDSAPDILDSDDDNDNFSDEEEIRAGSNPKDPRSVPATPRLGSLTPLTVSNNQPIQPLTIPATSALPAEIAVTGLPEGLSATGGVISGTPQVAWEGRETIRHFTVTVTLTDSAQRVDTATFTLTVTRVGEKKPPVGTTVVNVLKTPGFYALPLGFLLLIPNPAITGFIHGLGAQSPLLYAAPGEVSLPQLIIGLIGVVAGAFTVVWKFLWQQR